MTSVAMRAGSYAFTRAWAQALPCGTSRLVFLAADLAAFAALDAKVDRPSLQVEYWQHGFFRRSIPVPSFDRIVALNGPEARYLQMSSGCRDVALREVGETLSPATRAPCLLFASIYDVRGLFSRESHGERLKEFFAWAAQNGLQVVIRPHPREDSSFWRGFPGLVVDTARVGFSDCVARWSPRLVASWASTALLDGLRAGIMPVLLVEGSAPILDDMVFPLETVALLWPKDRERLASVLADETAYTAEWEQRHALAFAPLQADGSEIP